MCELREHGPFVLAFVFHPVERCRDQLPALERVAAQHRDVQFRVVAVRANASDARGLRSGLPVGYDNDGAVANEYAVVVCPTITYVGAAARSRGRRSACRAKRNSTSGCDGLSELALVCETVEVQRAALAPGRARAAPGVVGSHPAGPGLRSLRDRDDPARHRFPPPAEVALRDRLVRGGYRSRGLLADALLIAVVETGVGVWAVDAVDELRIEEGCVVGARSPCAAVHRAPEVSSPRVTLFGVVVPGVAVGVVEEAVQIAAEIAAGSGEHTV